MLAVLSSVFVVLVALVLPLGALVWLIAKRRNLVWPYLAGALTFFVSQMVLRVPLLNFLNTQAWYVAFTLAQPVVYSLLLGLSAGVFEEAGRYAAMRLTMRGRQTWQAAVAFGIGHGGIEAILLVGVNYLVLLAVNVVAPGVYPFSAAGMILMAGSERLFTMLAHVGFSVMVMRSVQRKNIWWLVLAVALHGVVDGMLGIFKMAGWSAYAIEVYVALWGLALLAYTILTIRKEIKQNEKTVETL